MANMPVGQDKSTERATLRNSAWRELLARAKRKDRMKKPKEETKRTEEIEWREERQNAERANARTVAKEDQITERF